MENSINREFAVKITRSIPEGTTTKTETQVFVCGNYVYGNNEEVGYKYRGEAHISEECGVCRNICDISIYGLSLEKLNEFTFTWWEGLKKVSPLNTIEVIVEGETVFKGDTFFLQADFSNVPDVCLRITGIVGRYIGSIVPETKTFEGIKVSEAFKQVCQNYGMTVVVDPKVDTKVPKIVLSGSVLDRIQRLGKSLGLNVAITDNVVRVGEMNKQLPDLNSANANFPVKEISKDTGLIGYPIFNDRGATFSMVFDPLVRSGSLIQLNSIVPKITNQYVLITKRSILSTLPKGQWKSECICSVVIEGDKK